MAVEKKCLDNSMAGYWHKKLLISCCGFLFSIRHMCQILVSTFINFSANPTFMNFSANPLASRSSGVTTFVFVPAHFLYIWYWWLSFPLNGGWPSVFTVSRKPSVTNILSMIGSKCRPQVKVNKLYCEKIEQSKLRSYVWVNLFFHIRMAIFKFLQ